MLEERRYTVEEVKAMDYMEIRKIRDVMYTRYEEEFYLDDYITCRHCPLEDVCGKCELYWGCGVWEESMGDDL